jgi:hypothetical protein
VAAEREPLDARTGTPIEPEDRGRLERPEPGSPAGKDREGLADTADPRPDDNVS